MAGAARAGRQVSREVDKLALKVLVADDDPGTRELLRRILTECSFEVVSVENGQQAWETYHARRPSIVITDWEMPGLNGIELCSRIRQHDTSGYTYIVFLTSHSGRDHLIEGLSAGADDFISKPLHADELQVRLRVAQRILSLESHLRQANHDLLRMNERLLKMSRLDPLMEIGNRLAFEERFEEYDRRARKQGRGYALVMCDVDNFKHCNDNFGHQRGDDVLRQVAAAIRRRLRSDDAAFRYGGEEILMLLGRQELAGAVAAAERIRNSVAALEFTATDGGPPFGVTVSCGVICHSTDGADTCGRRDLVEMADRALYQAKRHGRNCVVGAFSGGGGVQYKTAREILGETTPAAASRPSKPSRVKAG
jgi:diguanylate cyclase (GGDEF)-like protein